MEVIIQKILDLVKKKMEEQGAYTRSAFKQFSEETIEYFIEKGKLSEDENLEFIKDRIMELYPKTVDKLS